MQNSQLENVKRKNKPQVQTVSVTAPEACLIASASRGEILVERKAKVEMKCQRHDILVFGCFFDKPRCTACMQYALPKFRDGFSFSAFNGINIGQGEEQMEGEGAAGSPPKKRF